SKADDQLSWKVLQHEKLAALREKLHFRKEQLSKDKAKVQEMGADLKVRFESLELSMDESKADDQLSWKVLQHEKLAALREKLHFRKEQLSK
nr:DOG1 domain-containing protein [Tanacetum cinerariifolium]